MSDKTYEAIYKIAKESETNEVIITIHGAEIKGTLLDCSEDKCVSGIVTLKNANVKCKMTGNEKHFSWLNIPSYHVLAFTFQCCLID